MATEIINAIIKRTTLGIEDHGILSAMLHIEWPGSGCGFGGYALDNWDAEKGRRVGVAFGAEFINQILNILEADKWESLPGMPLRIESEGLGGGIKRIGHFMKDKWFDPKALAAQMCAK